MKDRSDTYSFALWAPHTPFAYMLNSYNWGFIQQLVLIHLMYISFFGPYKGKLLAVALTARYVGNFELESSYNLSFIQQLVLILFLYISYFGPYKGKLLAVALTAQCVGNFELESSYN